MHFFKLGLITFAALSLWTGPVAFAHGDHAHCHKKNADGSLTNLTKFKKASDCTAHKGEWLAHNFHCHVERDGKDVDFAQADGEAACKQASGKWEAHLHKGNTLAE